MNGALPNWRGGGGWKYSGTSAGNCARSNPKTPVQNFVSETEQNRTERRSKTGFLRVEIEVDGIERVKNDTWSSSAGYGSAGGQPERRALPKGPLPRGRGMEYFVPRHLKTRPGPLAQSVKLRGFGAGPHGRDCNWSVGCLKLLECKEATHPPPSS